MTVDETPTRTGAFDSVDDDGRKLAVVYRCREKWETLQRTDNDQVRYCSNCSQPVFHVADTENFHRAVASGRCVMVKPAEPRAYFLGVPGFLDWSPKPLQWDE